MPDKVTISQLGYLDFNLPNINDPEHWSLKRANQFFALVWKGIDLLNQGLMQIDFNGEEEQIERDITQLLEPRIKKIMSGDEPFYVQHESPEMETRHSPSAKPPSYDIAFVIFENERLKFPIEAKVLKTDGNISKYIKDVKEAFCTCYYAPFSYEGGMIGYLLSGNSQKAFQNIGKSLDTILQPHPIFKDRPHKFSEHTRKIPKGKEKFYPVKFRCHHLIFEINNTANKQIRKTEDV